MQAQKVSSRLFWGVNDKSTQEFMEVFYDKLGEGLPKDVAIQQAKLHLLDRNYPEPFYWAGFVPMGDMQPLVFDPPSRVGYYVLGVLVVAGLVFGVRSKLKR